MPKAKNKFQETVRKARRLLGSIVKDFETMDQMCDENLDEEAFRLSFGAHRNICKLFNLGNSLPAMSGDPAADNERNAIIAEEIPVEMGFTEEGWFLARIPMLLPKKDGGNVDHLRTMLYPAFRRYFNERPVDEKFSKCVLIYRHVYDRERSERQYRDHDNIELNFVTDTVALYVMEDDAPLKCEHFYCSAAGSEERTEVYVLPQTDFMKWYGIHLEIPDEGMKIVDSEALI